MGSPFGYTHATILLMLRDSIGDPVGSAQPRFDSESLIRYLNRAQYQVVRDGESLVESHFTTALVAGQAEYTAPVAMIWDRVVQYYESPSDVRPMVFWSLEQFEAVLGRDPTVSGPPRNFTFTRGLGDDAAAYVPTKFRVWPTPGAAEDGKEMRVQCYKMPDAISSSTPNQALELDPLFCSAVLAYAEYLVKKEDGKTADASLALQQYGLEIRSVRGFRAKKSRSARPRITPRNSLAVGRKIPPWKPMGSDWF